MRNYLLMAMALLSFASCSENNADKKSESKEIAAIEKTISVDSLYNNLDGLIDKEIKIIGTVDHVCKHSGKRAFIFGQDENKRIRIEATGEIRGFDAELIGGDIEVVGKLVEKRLDQAYIEKVENELEEMDHHALGEENHDKYLTEKEQIEILKKEIAATEKGYKSLYHIDGITFKQIKK
jgi:hypothetical protein